MRPLELTLPLLIASGCSAPLEEADTAECPLVEENPEVSIASLEAMLAKLNQSVSKIQAEGSVEPYPFGESNTGSIQDGLDILHALDFETELGARRMSALTIAYLDGECYATDDPTREELLVASEIIDLVLEEENGY